MSEQQPTSTHTTETQAAEANAAAENTAAPVQAEGTVRKSSTTSTPLMIFGGISAAVLVAGLYMTFSDKGQQEPGESVTASVGGRSLDNQGASVDGGATQAQRERDQAHAQQAEAGTSSHIADANQLPLQESMPINPLQVPTSADISAANLSETPAPAAATKVEPVAAQSDNAEYRQAVLDAIAGTLDRRTPSGPVVATFVRKGDLQTLSATRSQFEQQMQQVAYEAEINRTTASLAPPSTPNGFEKQQGEAVVVANAGAIETGYIVNSLNSDAPGPVKIVVADGPLAGSAMLGTMERKDKRVTVHLMQMILPEKLGGYHVPVNAVVLDAMDLSIGAASEVNNHYLLRYGVQPAMAALVGAANAIAGSRTRSTVVDGVVVQDSTMSGRDIARIGVGSAASQIYTDVSRISTDPTVKVNQGEPVAILFLQPVAIVPGQSKLLAAR